MQKKKIQRNEGCRLNPKKIDDELGQLVTWWSDTTPHPIDLVYSNSADWNFLLLLGLVFFLVYPSDEPEAGRILRYTSSVVQQCSGCEMRFL